MPHDMLLSLYLSHGHHQVMSLVVHTSTWSTVIWLTEVQVSPWNFFNFVTLALQMGKRNSYKLDIDPFSVERWWVHGHLVLQNLKTGRTLHKFVVDYQCWFGFKWAVQQINFTKFLSTIQKISRSIVASLSWSFHIFLWLQFMKTQPQQSFFLFFYLFFVLFCFHFFNIYYLLQLEWLFIWLLCIIYVLISMLLKLFCRCVHSGGNVQLPQYWLLENAAFWVGANSRPHADCLQKRGLAIHASERPPAWHMGWGWTQWLCDGSSLHLQSWVSPNVALWFSQYPSYFSNNSALIIIRHENFQDFCLIYR